TEPGGALVAPHTGVGEAGATVGTDADDEHAPATPTPFVLGMAPVSNDQGVQGVVEVFQRPGARPDTQRGYLNYLLKTCDLAGDYLRSRRLVHLADKQSLWEQLESFTRTAHENLDVRESAYTIANEGRRLIGCDRVTVAVQRGSRVAIEAISGLDTFDKRSNAARLLTKAARAVTKTAEDVWYSGDTSDFAPQVERAIDAYVDESNTKQMAILPMVVRESDDPNPEDKRKRRKGPPKVLGCLIVEQMVDSTTPEGYRQRVDVVRAHSTTAIGNALEHEGLFLMPVWKLLGRAMWLFRGPALPKTAAALLAAGGLLAAALLVPTDFTVQTTGELKPKRVASVFAQVTGDVKAVLVKQGQRVRAGQVLVEQQSLELQKQFVDIKGQIAEAVSQQRTLREEAIEGATPQDRYRAAAELAQIDTRVEWLQRQLQVLGRQQEKLTVRAPADGQVIDWKVDEKLTSRPVRQGDVIMEIADPSEGWLVELSAPEKRMGHIARTWNQLQAAGGEEPLRVEFYPATHPEEAFEGRVVKIDTTAEARGEEGNTVLMTVEFDQQEFLSIVTEPKLGAGVQAKVYCGTSSIAYKYTHDMIDAIRAAYFRYKP
ncbi:MAG: HlyD family efflux transporter periplasmic adaptor subunit, partial [Planctomycetota bacterium]